MNQLPVMHPYFCNHEVSSESLCHLKASETKLPRSEGNNSIPAFHFLSKGIVIHTDPFHQEFFSWNLTDLSLKL